MQTCKSSLVPPELNAAKRREKSPGFVMTVSIKATENVNALQLKLKESLLKVKHAALTAFVALAHQTFQNELDMS